MFVKNKISIFVSLLVFIFIFSGQLSSNDNSVNEADTKLRAILDKYTSIQAEFSQSVVDEKQNPIQESQGKLTIVKPNKLRWLVTHPDETTLIANGVNIYSVDPFVEQVSIMSQQQINEANPLMLLLSDDEGVWQTVNVSTQEGKYYLDSNDSTANIQRVILSFDESNILSSIVSIDKQQQTNSIVLAKVVLNQSIDTTYFDYTVPEGWQIDDQRSN